jgi:hypothetical protein
MPKNNFEPISCINDIKRNVQEFIRIIKEERDSVVIQRFKEFTYWYYFPEQKIFVPNKFLGYKNSAFETYNPSQGSGMDGTTAKKALEPYFKAVLNRNKQSSDLYSKLNEFTRKLGYGLRKNIFIFELKEQYYNIFNQTNISDKEQKNDSSIKNDSPSEKYAILIKAPRPSSDNEKHTVKTNGLSIRPIESDGSEDTSISTPSISSNNEINKYLNQVSSKLVRFLDRVLFNITNDWWKKNVINKLTDSQRAMTRKKNITSLKELDIAALLRVFEQNCYEISQQCSFTYREGRHSVDGVILVRNRWAHSPSTGYTENVTKRDVDILQCFLNFFNDEV